MRQRQGEPGNAQAGGRHFVGESLNDFRREEGQRSKPSDVTHADLLDLGDCFEGRDLAADNFIHPLAGAGDRLQQGVAVSSVELGRLAGNISDAFEQGDRWDKREVPFRSSIGIRPFHSDRNMIGENNDAFDFFGRQVPIRGFSIGLENTTDDLANEALDVGRADTFYGSRFRLAVLQHWV